MRYMDIKEASEKWGISDRRIRILCNEGRVDGAVKLNWSWTIPEDTPKPRDGRVLRKFRNFDIRPGSVDVARLMDYSESYPIDSSLKENIGYETIIASSFRTLLNLSGRDIPEGAAARVLSGKLSGALSLEDHLLIVNFRSVMKSLVDKKDKWYEKDLKESYVRLMQGINDTTSAQYRDGFLRYPSRGGDNVRTAVQMETLLCQYESSWKNLHGAISSVLLFGELLRIEPYDEHNYILAYLILSGELLRNGILPPLMRIDQADEIKASLSLALKRGNYVDFTHYIERSIFASYRMVSDV